MFERLEVSVVFCFLKSESLLVTQNGILSSDLLENFPTPTDLLSNQHYHFIKNITKGLNITVALLTAKIDKEERIFILNKISRGHIDIVIGTHSLISDKVTFNNLGIAVIDEQHKFGVVQRSKVLAKGENVHLLLLTATQIPRSLSMTIYGDLDLSEIKEKPKNRKKL